jgi:hypothetical protein
MEIIGAFSRVANYCKPQDYASVVGCDDVVL